VGVLLVKVDPSSLQDLGWWVGASLSERSIVEYTRVLCEAPDACFASQIHVTVAVAMLIDSAASTNNIAVRVLHLLLTGRVGDKISWTPVRLRLAKIKQGLVKYSIQPQAQYSPQSVRRLDLAFYQPIATSFPEIKTHFQQAKADASAARRHSRYFGFLSFF
jgi:hypothetical protein